MSRGRRAAEARPTLSPESPDLSDSDPQWSSLTDTGSLQPSAEALDWQRRADAWAQEAENNQAVEPANRWSEVATGRPTFPADGVGWRTETAEWRATGARWRQTTEWRSTTGSHGWRSTTEAWQTGGNSSYPPSAETPMAQPAISSTAWQSDDPSGTGGDARPAWQQFTDAEPTGKSAETWQATTPSWQQTEAPQNGWQTPEAQPTWRSAEPSQNSWQTAEPQNSWQSSESPQNSWRTAEPPDSGLSPQPPLNGWQTPDQPQDTWRTTEASRNDWQAPEQPQSSWRTPEPSQNGRQSPEQPRDSWRTPEASQNGWQAPEPPRNSWQATEPPQNGRAASQTSWQTPDQPQSSRRSPDPTPSWNQSGWQQPIPPATPSWQQSGPPAPTSRLQAGSPATPGRQQPEPPATPGWQQPAQRPPAESSPSWQQLVDPNAPAAPETPSWRRGAIEGTATWSDLTDSRTRPEAPSWQRSNGLPQQPAPQSRDDGRHLVREDDRAAWRRQTGEPQAGRRRAPEAGARMSGGTGWTTPSDSDNWAGHTDTGNIQLYPEPAAPEAPSWGSRRALPATPHEEPTYQIPPATPYETGRRRSADTSGARALPPGRSDEAPRGGRRRAEEARAEAPPAGRRAGRYPEDEPDQAYPQRRAAAQSAAVPLDDIRSGRRRRDEADRPAAEAKGRARYNPGRDDWREQTGSWEAEPDTSSWTRDPDTGQWSRAEDDPRVLAWRREAARREEMTGQQRALPAAPAEWDADDDDDPPPPRGGPRGGAVAPRSGTAYGSPRGGGQYGSAPTSAIPSSGPGYGGPRGDTYNGGPRGDTYSGGPRGETYSGGPRGETYGGSPRGETYGGGRPHDGRGVYGSAPSNALPSGAPPRFTGSAQASGAPYGGGPQSAQYSGAPYGGAPSSKPRSGTPYGGAPSTAPRSGTPYGTGRRRAEPDPAAGLDALGRPALDPALWHRDPESPESRQNRRLGLPDDAAPSWAARGDASTDHRQRLDPGEWHRREREERARGSATYRDGGGNDWRQDLADQSNLAEGESRRYGTSDFIPFRSSGSAAVPGSSNLSLTSTSLISPVPREQREAEARPARSSNGFQGLTGSYERRAVTGGLTTGRRSNLLDPDDEEDDQEESANPLAAVGYTVIWYGVPVVLFVLYMLVVNTGSQTHALDTLAKAAPQFGISLVLSIAVAFGLRFVSHSWKAISVGLAAAVVGGGLATVLTSAITGNSLS